MSPDPLPEPPAAPDPQLARLSDDLDPAVETAIGELMGVIGDPGEADLIRQIVRTAALLSQDDTERLDLKIVRAAVAEMREAFAVFAPYRDVPKVTIFGSARTQMGTPLYDQARRIAAELADAGWMVITGAGPGIMQAGMEGAGRDLSIGVSIRLPFEEGVNEIITGDPKLVTMKYFFTRKLMLMKESAGFVALPGGFGTIDETMELLTLQQTGKAVPAPVILLDEPGGGYWEGWARFVTDHLISGRYINPTDIDLADRTDDVAVAAGLLTGFYRRYHSIRWVGTRLVIRTTTRLSDEDLADINARFGHLWVKGHLERATPFSPERADDDHLDLPRLACTYDVHQSAALHHLVRAINATGG